MRGSRVWMVGAVALALLWGASAQAQDHQYVGATKCKTCHKKELIGNQYGAWEEGAHSKAFDTLKSDKAVEIGAKKGLAGPPHESPDCLKCHVTGYGEPESAFAKPLKHSDGIQCESCHGPGSDYKKKKVMSDREKSIAAGMWEPGKDEKICLACHNDESPTFEEFDYEERKEKIAHPIPEDVKGNYIEMEKKLKKEKGGGDDDEEDEE